MTDPVAKVDPATGARFVVTTPERAAAALRAMAAPWCWL